MNSNYSTALPNYLHSLLPIALHPWLLLSYPHPSSRHAFLRSTSSQLKSPPTLYSRGRNDVYFVAFCAITFTLLREIMLRYVLRWFAGWFLRRAMDKEVKAKRKGGLEGVDLGIWERREARVVEHNITRFAEQGWSFTYCTIFWTLGMVGPPYKSDRYRAHFPRLFYRVYLIGASRHINYGRHTLSNFYQL
jgi:acyl-CoA-dependent ceramide synthase